MTTIERQASLDSFIEHSGWGCADKTPLQADASFRRYIRLNREQPGNDNTIKRAMVMDAPPATEDVKPFINVAKHLTKMGFSAPVIMSEDINKGFLLLEDFGDNTFTQLLRQGVSERVLYETAIDTLSALHQHTDNNKIELAPYDQTTLLAESSLFVDWYMSEVTGEVCDDDLKAGFESACKQVFNKLPDTDATLVLRDFHVDNLMLLEDRSGVSRCGLLDFQDALLGSPAYDVTSLLEDARRDISPELKQDMLDRYFASNPNIDKQNFMLSYHILSVQRHAKIIGIFTRLYRRDHKSIYLNHIPRVVKLMQQHLSHPALTPIANWLQQKFPNYQSTPASLLANEDVAHV